MATTRSNTLGSGSVSSWTRMVAFSDMTEPGSRKPRDGGPGAPVPNSLRAERVLGRVLLGGDLVDLGEALHGVLDGHLGGLVVVLVDLGVVLRVPVDEHPADDHVLFG